MKLGLCGFTIGAAAYYRRFPVVEVQQTFYDPPPPATLQRWRAEAPPDFEFTLKAWQVITHAGTSVETLRASVILFQCPPSFRPSPDNIASMREFFAYIERPPGVRFAWEPRGAWPDDVVRGLCDDLQLIHAVDPFIRPSLTPDVLYWRLHGNGSHYASYTDAELRELCRWLPRDDRDAYVLFNNIPRVGDVERFRERATEARPETSSNVAKVER